MYLSDLVWLRHRPSRLKVENLFNTLSRKNMVAASDPFLEPPPPNTRTRTESATHHYEHTAEFASSTCRRPTPRGVFSKASFGDFGSKCPLTGHVRFSESFLRQ